MNAEFFDEVLDSEYQSELEVVDFEKDELVFDSTFGKK